MNTTDAKLRAAFRYVFIVALMVVTGACASSNVPAPNTSNAESMIGQAEEAGAQEYAPLQLRNARKKIEQAKALVRDERFEEATRLTEEASIDAELATITSRSQKAQEAVKQLQETIDTLRNEIERKRNNS
jgi:hypothetical protein